MNVRKIQLICAFFIVVFSVSCVREPERSAGRPKPVVIAVVLATSGVDHAAFGISAKHGVELAIEQYKALLAESAIEFRFVDTQGSVDVATSQMRELVSDPSVIGIIGEITSELTVQIAPIAQQAGVALLAPASTAAGITEIGNWIFRSCFLDSFQANAIAQFARNTLKSKTAWVQYRHGNAYSEGLAGAFTEHFSRLGGVVVGTAGGASEKDSDFELKQIVGKKPDVVFLPGYYSWAGEVAKSLGQRGYSGTFLGSDGWDSLGLRKLGGKPVEEAYFASHFSYELQSPTAQEFVKQFKNQYRQIPDALAALGYDSARIVVEALKRAPKRDRQSLRQELTQTRNFDGVTGLITLNKSRDAVKPAFILKVGVKGPFSYVSTITP